MVPDIHELSSTPTGTVSPPSPDDKSDRKKDKNQTLKEKIDLAHFVLDFLTYTPHPNNEFLMLLIVYMLLSEAKTLGASGRQVQAIQQRLAELS